MKYVDKKTLKDLNCFGLEFAMFFASRNRFAVKVFQNYKNERITRCNGFTF